MLRKTEILFGNHKIHEYFDKWNESALKKGDKIVLGHREQISCNY